MFFTDYILRYLHFFTIQIVIIGLVLFWRSPKRKLFYVRLLLFIPFILIFTSIFTDIFGIPSLNRYFTVGGINFGYIISFIVFLAICAFCFNLHFFQLLYLGTVSYAVQHIGSYTLLFFVYLNGNGGAELSIWAEVIGIFITAAVTALMFFILGKTYYKMQDEINKHKIIICFSAIILLLISILSAVVNALTVLGWSSFLYSVLVDIFSLVMLFMFYKYKGIEEKEKVMEHLFIEQSKNEQLYDNTVKVINMKCHDLKYQIAALRDVKGSAVREEKIKELEDAVMVYDTKIKSGNEALDTILMEKNLHCKKSGIQLNFIGSAERLGFMDTVDVYTLFGNAIDNAYEAVLNLPEDKRLIIMTVEERSSLLRITVENYTDGNVVLVDGMPQTTKEDKNFHGFGVQSMKFIAERYGGNMKINFEDNWFKINFLFFA